MSVGPDRWEEVSGEGREGRLKSDWPRKLLPAPAAQFPGIELLGQALGEAGAWHGLCPAAHLLPPGWKVILRASSERPRTPWAEVNWSMASVTAWCSDSRSVIAVPSLKY